MLKKISRVIVTSLLLVTLSNIGLSRLVRAQTSPATTVVTDQKQALAAIEAKLETRRKELGIPGVSLAIVKDDRIIYSRGLGYKDLEKNELVTPNTQFAIGSATKAFTALTALMAVDEGKLSLDDSPKKYLPYFKMYDPETDKNITVRDLMCHSSGLNRTDLAMITGKLNRAELIQVAAQAKPTAKLREKFQYQNIMFTAAGEIVATVEKEPWEKIVTTRILKPLAMNNSTTSMSAMEKAQDHSLGYSYNFDTKQTERLPFRDIAQVAPAGAINSTANDMAQWLRFVLNGGVVKGKRLLSEKGYEEWIKPQMKIGAKMSYGLGWFLDDWNGMKVIQHGGNIDGFNSMVAMIPEKKIGFVLLTNVSASPLGNEMMRIVWENLLAVPSGAQNSQTAGTKTSFPTDPDAAKELVGKYKMSSGATADIRESAGKVTFNIGEQQPYTLGQKAKDVFSMSPLPDSYSLAAKRDGAGNVTSIVVSQPEGDFEFKRSDAASDDKPKISVEELMQSALDAIGGEANLRKFSSRIIESDLDLENQGVKGTSISYSKAPNKSASETTFTALGKTIARGWEFFDGSGGEEAYSFAPAEKYEGKRLDDARLSADFYSQLDWKTKYKTVEIVGTAKVADEDAYVVNFVPNNAMPFKNYYSTKTFLLIKQTGFVPSSTSSQSIPYTVTFSDYREVDGIKLAFKTVNSSISNGNIIATIRSVENNPAIDDKIFAPRKLQ